MKRLSFILLFILFYASSFSQNTGCVYGDCGNGYGKYVWESGDEYIGNWKDYKQNGNGSFTFSTGGKYTGEFKNGQRYGSGTYIWTDGEKHTGQWMNDKQHGEGTYFKKDGTSKTGVWKNGVYQGKIGEVTGCIFGDCTDGYGTYVWSTGEKYTGNWANNSRKGQGTNYFATGARYEGEWSNDLRNGYGTNYYTDGTTKAGLWENDRYTGTSTNNYGCISGDCANGYGIYTWDTGERYEGYWKNDMRNGQGTNYFATGAEYTGNWKDDKKDGYGVYKYKSESQYKSYTGDYVMDKLTGNGIFLYKNGQKYIGELLNNYFHGEGTMYYTDGTTKTGTWEYDKFIKSNEIKTGCISGDCSNGFGTYVTKKGDKYVGTFRNSYFSGRGTYTFAAGDVYEGEFKNGTYEGQGTYSFISGTKYVGEFKNGTYNGIGTAYYTNGTTQSGLWENGEFIGNQKSKSPPQVTWLSPQYATSSTSLKSVKAKVCIKSDSELENVQFLVNGKVKVNYATRGYTVVNANCDYTIERDVPVENGTNKITVKVTNAGGEVLSDTRIVNLQIDNISTNQKRLALVIGNGEYLLSPLKNPVNDAQLMAEELRKLGFDVMSFTDLSQNDMKSKIREFGNKLSKQKGVGLFYYAGHGIQLNGENYLVPVSAVINKEQDVELEAVNLKRVLGEMDYAQNDLNIVILDACRNNPFARSFRSGGGNGLASTTAPKGTFIAYATAPGSVASDGTGENGLYTQELVKALEQPGSKIEDVFKAVRNNVYKMSNEMQVPWENSSIFGDFYFKK
ncbi:MAG: hypothetical protein DRI94_04470 [Bacteroidetes bacterium]|nr:MAG: hypothetical protein DRI94_04470 [Bacteroidota bacterium]